MSTAQKPSFQQKSTGIVSKQKSSVCKALLADNVYQRQSDAQQKFQLKYKGSINRSGGINSSNILQQNSIDTVKDLEKQFKSFDDYIYRDAPSNITTDSKVVVIGDVHGDMQKLLQSLLLAQVIQIKGENIVWTGEDTTVVQLGDVLDRGSSEIGILVLLRRLDIQAKFNGGAVYMLNGNHEAMNATSQFKAVSRDGYQECCNLLDNVQYMESSDQQFQARDYMFKKGGPVAKELSRNPVTLKINNILFAHGGILPEHCKYGLGNLNHEVSQWFQGQKIKHESSVRNLQLALQGSQSVVWNRDYSMPCTSSQQRISALDGLDSVLKSEDAEYMVIGHTPQQQGANCAFGGKVWRMDVGMSSGIYGVDPQVLEITWDCIGQTNFNLLRSQQVEGVPTQISVQDNAYKQSYKSKKDVHTQDYNARVKNANRSYVNSDFSGVLAQQRSYACI